MRSGCSVVRIWKHQTTHNKRIYIYIGKLTNATLPFIDTGALCVLELLSRTHSVEEVGEWCRGCTWTGQKSNATGCDTAAMPAQALPLFDAAAVAATKADSGRNRRLCEMLQGAGLLPDTVDALERAVAYYAAMDCLLFTAPELARVAASFAETDPEPAEATAAASPASSTAAAVATLTSTDKRVVQDVMLRCGMYEASSSWNKEVGLPAKSGVSGSVWAVVPNVGGICCHQPRIDADGNGVQAMALIRAVTEGVAKRYT